MLTKTTMTRWGFTVISVGILAGFSALPAQAFHAGGYDYSVKVEHIQKVRGFHKRGFHGKKFHRGSRSGHFRGHGFSHRKFKSGRGFRKGFSHKGFHGKKFYKHHGGKHVVIKKKHPKSVVFF